MSDDYWASFRANAKKILEARAPHGWKVAKIEAWEDRGVATFDWADDHLMTIDVHSRQGHHDALEDIAQSVESYRRKRLGPPSRSVAGDRNWCPRSDLGSAAQQF